MKIIKMLCWILLLIFLLLLMGCDLTTYLDVLHAPDITSVPVTSSLVGELYSYDVEATDPDGDPIIYSLISNPIGMYINTSSGVISWTPTTAGDYDVIVRASDGDLFDDQSFTITVSITEGALPPPNEVFASKGWYGDKVYITWNPVNGATHYRVYRAMSVGGIKTAISNWQTENYYFDEKVQPVIFYWYWVKAATSSSGENASDYSESDKGWAISSKIDSPTGVSASDIYFDRVQITWNSVTEATHYKVYRADSLIGVRATISGWQTGTSFNDKGATPGVTYWYWVKAATSSSGENASDYSDYDTGKILGVSL